MEYVVLVDTQDNELGVMEKLEAHQKGELHRAISLFIFNSKGELLLQQRALDKYHCGGLWTNTVCSHPRKGESFMDAAHRRLQEEMGFDCELTEKFRFIYRAEFDNGLIEHELDCVFTGVFDGTPILNTQEAANYKWISLDDLRKEIEAHPEQYTVWLKIALKRFS